MGLTAGYERMGAQRTYNVGRKDLALLHVRIRRPNLLRALLDGHGALRRLICGRANRLLRVGSLHVLLGLICCVIGHAGVVGRGTGLIARVHRALARR